MAKDGFVRDNLIDMRDHLKAAREAILAGTDPHEAARQAEAAATTARGEAKNSIHHPVPAVDADGADPRTLREFHGRIIHDRSAVEAELQQLELQRSGLEKFHRILTDTEAQLAGSENIGSRKLEQLQFSYYMAAGEYKGAAGDRSNAPAAGNPPELEPGSMGRIFAGSLPVAIAILAGSALIAVTIALIFA